MPGWTLRGTRLPMKPPRDVRAAHSDVDALLLGWRFVGGFESKLRDESGFGAGQARGIPPPTAGPCTSNWASFLRLRPQRAPSSAPKPPCGGRRVFRAPRARARGREGLLVDVLGPTLAAEQGPWRPDSGIPAVTEGWGDSSKVDVDPTDDLTMRASDRMAALLHRGAPSRSAPRSLVLLVCSLSHNDAGPARRVRRTRVVSNRAVGQLQKGTETASEKFRPAPTPGSR
jgi:hypothetical protein